MADSLDDDFLLDSDVESVTGAPAAGSKNGKAPASAKRKRGAADAGAGAQDSDDDDDDGEGGKRGFAAQAEKDAKKRKRKADKERRKRKKQELEAVKATQKPMPLLPPDVQAEQLREYQRQAFPKMSTLELGEMTISESCLANVADVHEERSWQDLAPLCRQAVSALATALADRTAACNTQKGRPALLMLTGNAMRAAELTRALRPLLPSGGDSQEEGKSKGKKSGSGENGKGSKREEGGADDAKQATVAKLFARHFKVQEQAEFLRTHITPLAVGTSARVSALLDLADEGEEKEEAEGKAASAPPPLELTEVRAIVVDASWRDAKARSVVDGLDTRQELFRLLARREVKERLRDGACKLVLF